MRNKGAADASMLDPGRSRGQAAAPASWKLLVGFRLPHDLLRGEVDAAGGEGIADEEIVGFVGIEIRPGLEVRVLGDREGQPQRLRHDLAFKRSDGRLDGDGDLRRTGTRRRAFQALARKLRAELAEAVLRLAAERDDRMLG